MMSLQEPTSLRSSVNFTAWLKANERIDFKLAVLVSIVSTGLRRHTLPMNLVVQLTAKLDADICMSSVELALRPCMGDRSFPVAASRVYGTIFDSTSSRQLPFESLKIVSRLIFFFFLSLIFFFAKCLRGDFYICDTVIVGDCQACYLANDPWTRTVRRTAVLNETYWYDKNTRRCVLCTPNGATICSK